MNAGMGRHGPLQRLSSSTMHFANPEQFFLPESSRRMLYHPQQFFYQKSQSNNYPASSSSIKRSSNGGNDVFSYINQMVKNNLKSTNNMNGYTYLLETPLYDNSQQDLSPPSSAQLNQFRKDVLKNENLSNSNLQAAASSNGHLSFVAPPSSTANSNLNTNINKLSNNVQNSNQLNSQLTANQINPVYRPIEENRSNEKINLDNYAIKEQDFDQKQLVHSQLSQIEFKNSPELTKLEENLKRSVE